MSERRRKLFNFGSVTFVMLSPVSVWISKVFAHNIIRKKRDFFKLVSCFSMEEFILEDLISLFD